ncbi:MAG: CCA tRNA nucleotidyltransferase [Candidatus Altiarchaeota archaeon]|nr:CCA tRNA nucleotidyltransferase [Candidatus Altiarchaeota archaeon]
MERVFKEILATITPTKGEHEEERRIVEDISGRLAKFEVKPILVGSLAKGTDVRGDKDIDIFIMFDKETGREELEKRGLEIGKKVFGDMKIPYEIDYAEHPYISGRHKKYKIEIVPCYDTKELKCAVDRTPYHTQYVKRKLAQKPEQRGDVRLLKQFMKTAGVYGAEAKVEGFSGYLCELLVINYGSFQKVLEATAKWSFGEAIDPAKLWKEEKTLKYFFTNACLIIVDPVDRDRNAAAAVSKQKLAEFIVASSEFLKKPDKRFFTPKKEKVPDKKELRRRMHARGTELVALEFIHGRINSNTLYSQLRKTKHAVEKSVMYQGFRVLKSDIWTDEKNSSRVLFDMEVSRLPNIKHHFGPPIDKAPKEQERFIEKYGKYKPYIKDGRWVVDTRREYTKIGGLMEDIIKKRYGFGKNLRELERITVVDGKKLLETGDAGFLVFMGGFLTPI